MRVWGLKALNPAARASHPPPGPPAANRNPETFPDRRLSSGPYRGLGFRVFVLSCRGLGFNRWYWGWEGEISTSYDGLVSIDATHIYTTRVAAKDARGTKIL